MKDREIVEVSGVSRYKLNKIVAFLLETGPSDLDQIGGLSQRGVFDTEDIKEFYQLIGYSVESYNEIFEG